ncbi:MULTISPECIES: stage II sporulation protein M [unclassified Arcicella]|uniref:stage II sporulation protein M n=1 Tax=unclassified Arcicella TaxID=2644986 RepID=UPI00285B5F07|nr:MULTISPECIES: stage II sporulation protein M [unclassified Arcicella]MDR6561143.1 putative membrane protein SpoIIM required for sporulation [Arcicella sp. BE51]MDR6811027.1 putative membrane protein SpoIIM required for sporulation [Arcicella sp. BE140]MDR6822377.1 putative membrane protein SpoIIM required for sporulation [Arcicella sp. BE139]
MREALFKKHNLDKWQEFEEDSVNVNPDILSERFVELTDDLSYARTFYPDSPTTQYLNGLTSTLFSKIYSNKREKANRFITFWKVELPTLFYNSQRQLLFSFIIFGISALLGAVSAAYDDSFARLILGDSYVEMTLENIEKGDPLAIYGNEDEITMFFMITINNIRVSFITFVMGIFFSIGTGYFLVFNGIMVGVFQYFCYQHGFLETSLLTIWLHGTLEISSIVIAGCAGLVMGNSLLFPKTFTRLASFKKGAKQGLKIIIGLVPLFIVAGFIESFLTRKHLSLIPSLMIILPSALFIIWYFVVYPIQLNRFRNEKNTQNNL